ncbi:hypothetical protein NW768_010911 [Fusarium equiseti]|uniref:Ankyrin n=1 Tax=Fusarium equiseti TaxID=61235 RepID=A0ABQ8QYN7_FUSEQ|nr:hypothetical protein NW768_010911 [Fusarium equiseti]
MDPFIASLEPPMWKAIREGNITEFNYQFCQFLRAPFNQKDEYGCSGYDYMACAIQFGQVEIVRAMVSLPSWDLDYGDYRSYLKLASLHKKPAIFKIIADTGRVDITGRGDDRYTPLHHACQMGCVQIVDYLLKEGAAPDERDNFGRTPLCYAALEGSLEVTRRLLEVDRVNPDVLDDDGKSPFYWAVYRGHSAVAKILSDTGRVNNSVEGDAMQDRDVVIVDVSD